MAEQQRAARQRTVLLLASLGLAALMVGAGGAPAAAAAPGCDLVPAPSPPADSLLGGVATFSRTDAWAVGRSRSAAGDITALTEHWNGTAWQVVPGPSEGQSSSLSAVAILAAGYAWAVGAYAGGALPGDRALVEQWNGRSWVRVPGPQPGDTSELNAVTVISARNAWAVGGYTAQAGGAIKPFAVHWNGRKWRRVPVPITSTGILSGVSATGWNDVWAVGFTETAARQVLILHWNGRSWRRAAYRGPAGSSYLSAVSALSPTDVWAVGNTIRGTDVGPAFTVRWTGRKWARVPIPDAGTSVLSGVTAISAQDAWAAGGGADQAVAEHWNGANWTAVPVSPPGASSDLEAVAASSPSNVWAVGSYHATPSDLTLALHCG